MRKLFPLYRVLVILIGCLSVCTVQGSTLNVRDFGAVGDGKTDDTVAIQRALNKLNEQRKSQQTIYANDLGYIPSWGLHDGPNGEIIFPAGTYRITRPLVGTQGVNITGENGSIISAEFDNLPILYLERALRCTIREITFRGGLNAICFWTANQDAALMLFENCRFENSAEYAVTTKSYADRKFHTVTSWDKVIPVAPFTVKWGDDGMPALTPFSSERSFFNSTLVIVRNCQFFNCTGAVSGSTDGQSILNCSFVSEKSAALAVFKTTGDAIIENVDIKAAVPKNFSGAWIECGLKFDARKICAQSTTEYGAPLLRYQKEYIKQGWCGADSIRISDCVASSANSPVNAMIDFTNIEPSKIEVSRCREYNGKKIALFRFGNPPKSVEELLRANPVFANFKQIPPEKSHRWLLSDNGPELRVQLPKVLAPYVQTIKNFYPGKGYPSDKCSLSAWNSAAGRTLHASEFGISEKSSPDDMKNLQKLLHAAGDAGKATILFPARCFTLTKTLTLPANVSLRAQGRTFFNAKNHSFPLFTVEGNKLDLEFVGLTFNGGADAVKIKGAGKIRIDNCLFYDNYGVYLDQTGKDALRLEMTASLFYAPVALTNLGADVLIRDTWDSIQGTLDNGPHIRNLRGGNLAFCNILGVPVLFLTMPQFQKFWKRGYNRFWHENDGTLFSSCVRYGGESDGLPILNNLHGRAAFIGRDAYYGSTYSARTFFCNQDPEAEILIHNVSSHNFDGRVELGKGIPPKKLTVTNFLDYQ